MISNELKTLNCVLCGACVTIQTAWRAYLSRKLFKKYKTYCSYFKDYDMENFSSSDEEESQKYSTESKTEASTNKELFLDGLVSDYLRTNFRCDVLIIVEDKHYFCHSYVLYCNSEKFKKLIETSYSLKRNRSKHFSFRYKLFVSTKCWEVLNFYMYGHEISVEDDIFDELVLLANELRIDDLVFELKNISIIKESQADLSDCQSGKVVMYQSFNRNNNNNNNTCSSSELESICMAQKSLTSLNVLNVSKSEELTEPFLIVSSYFQFFNSVVDLFANQKLDKQRAFGYLSNNEYIDYSQMSSEQLKTCIYLLKTKMKLKNSKLIVRIIDIYLSKRSLTQIVR
jgi:hypothetical protein